MLRPFLSIFPESFTVSPENKNQNYFPQHNKPDHYSRYAPYDNSKLHDLFVLSYWQIKGIFFLLELPWKGKLEAAAW